MKNFIKKISNRLKEGWYGALPYLVLLGIPTILCIIIGWKKIIAAVTGITDLGNGSFLLGMLLFLSILLVIFNLSVAFLIAIKNISEKTSKKWIYTYIITTVLGVIVLFIHFI